MHYTTVSRAIIKIEGEDEKWYCKIWPHYFDVAQVYDAFNGLNHDEGPREKDYIGGDDGEHTTEAGQKVIADLMRELGYDPIE